MITDTVKPTYALVVDDDNMVQMMHRGILEQLGYQVTVASSGTEAVQFTNEKTFDVICMDVNMPGMDGLEATHLIRIKEQSSSKHQPIIGITACGNEILNSCLENGMDAVLNKPVKKSELIKILEKYVNKSVFDVAPDQNNATKTTSTPVEADMQVINLELGAIETESSIDEVKESLGLFIKSLPEVQVQLEQAYQANDVESLIKISHKMHGGLVYCGAPRLKHAVKTLEVTLKNGEVAQLDQLYQKVCLEVMALISAYDQL